MGVRVYLLPNDFGEFPLVLQDGPDEQRLQGMPRDGRHVLGGGAGQSTRSARAKGASRELHHSRMTAGSGCPTQRPVFAGLLTWQMDPS